MIPDDLKRTSVQQDAYDDDTNVQVGTQPLNQPISSQPISNIAQQQTGAQLSPVQSSMTSTNKVSRTLLPNPQAVKSYGQQMGAFVNYKPTEYADSPAYKGFLDRYMERVKNPDEPFMTSLVESLVDPQEAKRKQQAYDERRKRYGAIVSLAEMLASGVDAIGAKNNAFTVQRTPNRTYSEETFREQARLDQQARMAQDLYLRAKESDQARQDREFHQAASYIAADQQRNDRLQERNEDMAMHVDERNAGITMNLMSEMKRAEDAETDRSMRMKMHNDQMAQDNRRMNWDKQKFYAQLGATRGGQQSNAIDLPTNLKSSLGGILTIRLPKNDEKRFKNWLVMQGKNILGNEGDKKAEDYEKAALSDPSIVLRLADHVKDKTALIEVLSSMAKDASWNTLNEMIKATGSAPDELFYVIKNLTIPSASRAKWSSIESEYAKYKEKSHIIDSDKDAKNVS